VPTRRSAPSLSHSAFDGPADELTLTHNAQPALLAHSAAVWAMLADVLTPHVVARGRSLARRVLGVSRPPALDLADAARSCAVAAS
jgi:[acyl-carrier-protein] S-malonyltransferase